MNVALSLFGTSHLIRQIPALSESQLLHTLFTALPKSYIVPYMNNKHTVIHSYPSLLAASLIIRKMTPFLHRKKYHQLNQLIHDHYSKISSLHLSDDIDAFIGPSSFVLDGLLKCRELKIAGIVDHGSMHERFELSQLVKEASEYGFSIVGNSENKSLIEKEDEEFAIASHVIAVSRIAKKSLVDNGVDASKITVINPGVDTSKFYPDRLISKKKFRVFYCGQFNVRKGLHYLLKAFKFFDVPDAELCLAGSYSELSLDQAFSDHISKLIDGRVKILGKLNHDSLRTQFQNASVFVLPSLADGFGMVAIQAMACGVPVIVTSNTGASDIVVDGLNGFVVSPRDSDAILGKLFYLYNNPEIMSNMGENAVCTASRSSTWEIYGQLVCQFVKQLA